jgi:hypothetical protein
LPQKKPQNVIFECLFFVCWEEEDLAISGHFFAGKLSCLIVACTFLFWSNFSKFVRYLKKLVVQLKGENLGNLNFLSI